MLQASSLYFLWVKRLHDEKCIQLNVKYLIAVFNKMRLACWLNLSSLERSLYYPLLLPALEGALYELNNTDFATVFCTLTISKNW